MYLPNMAILLEALLADALRAHKSSRHASTSSQKSQAILGPLKGSQAPLGLLKVDCRKLCTKKDTDSESTGLPQASRASSTVRSGCSERRDTSHT
jgi:hypothetical protein